MPNRRDVEEVQLNVTVNPQGQLGLFVETGTPGETDDQADSDSGTAVIDAVSEDAQSSSDESAWVGFDDARESTLKAGKLVGLDSLATLAMSTHLGLRESALELLLEKAMRPAVVSSFLAEIASLQTTPPENVRRAVVVLQSLTVAEEHRPALVEAGALPLLVSILCSDERDVTTLRYAMIALYRLLSVDGVDVRSVASAGLLAPLAAFLEAAPTHNNDLKYWSLLLVHALCLLDETHDLLTAPEQDFVPILASLCRRSFGNTNMQKMALHGLIRLTSGLPADAVAPTLQRLADTAGLCNVVVACLKSDDAEISSWAVFLLHEFVAKKVALEQFVHARGILRTLLALLDAESRLIPRVVLLILRLIAADEPTFRAQLIAHANGAFIEKLVGLLQSASPGADDDARETQLHALALLRDLLADPAAVQAFFEHNGIDAVAGIGMAATDRIALLVFDILSSLCAMAPGSADHAQALVQSRLLDLIDEWLRGALLERRRDAGEQSLSACALLMALATTHPVSLHAICEGPLVQTLVSVLLASRRAPPASPGGSEKLALLLAKTIFVVGRRGPNKVRLQLLSDVIGPLMDEMVEGAALAVKLLFPRFDSGAASKAADESEQLRSPLQQTRDALVEKVRDQERSPPVLRDGSSAFALLDSAQPLKVVEDGSDEEDAADVPDSAPGLTVDTSAPLISPTLLNGNVALSPTRGGSARPERALATPTLAPVHNPASPGANPTETDAPIDSFERAFTHSAALQMHLVSVTTTMQVLGVLLGGHRIFSKIAAYSGLGAEEVSLETFFDTERMYAFASALLDLVVLISAKNDPTPADELTREIRRIALESDATDRAKISTTQQALRLLATLFRYKTLTKYLIRERFIEVLAGMLAHEPRRLVADLVRTLALCANREGCDLEAIRQLRVGVLFVGPHARAVSNQPLPTFRATTLRFFAKMFVEALADHSHARHMDDPLLEGQFSEANRFDKTSAMHVSADRLDLLNDHWSFESVRASFGVTAGGRFQYEVVLWTAGIVQVGWATRACRFDPEAGAGVGDDAHSYAVDGQRCRRWHGGVGAAGSGDSYGGERPWRAGDVLTCLLDLSEGTVAYKLNGRALGTAFEGVDTSQKWYPALSLAAQQAVTLRFGTPLAPLQYPEPGYERVPDSLSYESEAVFTQLPDPLALERVRVSWSPWLYYEVIVGPGVPRRLQPERLAQIGVRDSYGNVIALVQHSGGLALVYIQGHNPAADKATFLKNLHAYLSSRASDDSDALFGPSEALDSGSGLVRVSGDARIHTAALEQLETLAAAFEPAPDAEKPLVHAPWPVDSDDTSYVVVATYGGLCLSDGDVVGVGACLSRTVQFQLNGVWLDPPVPMPVDLGAVPYLRHFSRTRILTVELPLSLKNVNLGSL